MDAKLRYQLIVFGDHVPSPVKHDRYLVFDWRGIVLEEHQWLDKSWVAELQDFNQTLVFLWDYILYVMQAFFWCSIAMMFILQRLFDTVGKSVKDQ